MSLEALAGPGRPFLLLGMVHLAPLPGSPRWDGSMAGVIEAARRDAGRLVEAGFDGVIVENFGDAPFLPGPVPPGTVAAMATVAETVRRVVGSEPLVGVNVLRNDARAALAVAVAAGADLVRVNVHTGAMWTDQGLIEGRAWETLRDRAHLGADHVAILADVLVKHAEPPVPTPVGRTAQETVERGLADAVVVTGPATGEPVNVEVLSEVGAAVSVPVLVGSGATAETLTRFAKLANGAIVGTAVKEDGRVTAPVDLHRARALVAARPGGAR